MSELYYIDRIILNKLAEIFKLDIG